MDSLLHIALLDDKSYGLDQIKARHVGEAIILEYFPSFREFSECGETFDLVYLDYYLEKDGLTGKDVLPEVRKQAKKIIAFSSVPRRNEELVRLGADDAVQKV